MAMWVEVDLYAGGQVVPALGPGAVLVHPRARKHAVGKAIVNPGLNVLKTLHASYM
jgi:predicted N-acetyltransferase YhbS